MMKKLSILITIIVLVLYNLNIVAQTDTEFWFVKPNITSEHTNESFKIVFTAREFDAVVIIKMPAEPLFIADTFFVAAYTTYTYNVIQPSGNFTLLENSTLVDQLGFWPNSLRDNIGNKAILVTSSAPINAYLTQTANNNSDIYALKGGNGIGTEFIIPFQEHGFNQHDKYTERAFSSIDIISFEDGTVVEITPPAGKDVFRNGTFQNETNTYTDTIDRGQVYTVAPGWDPTVIREYENLNGGSPPPPTWATAWWKVEGAEHLGGIIVKVLTGTGVAVVKKDDSVRKGFDVGASSGGWDIIADQWVPYKGVVGQDNDILGKEYVAMRGGLKAGWEWVYCAAPENNTRIWWGNVDTTDVANLIPDAIIQRGQQVGIPFDDGDFTNNYMEIISNNPLSVLHVSGDDDEMGGAVLPPIDKCTGSTSVSFARDIDWPFYINIMARAGAQGDFLVDGVVRNDIINPAAFDIVGITGEWMATQIFYADGDESVFAAGDVHTISNTNDVFHVGLINGSEDGGCRFGYFSDFNELKVSANTIQGGGIQPSSSIRACKGDTVQLYASGGSVFNWWPSTNLSNDTISNPTAVVDEFRTYFVEVSGACNNKDTATVTVETLPQPEAVFLLEKGQGCAPVDLEIRNLSTEVNQIYWDFNNTGIGGNVDRDTTKYDPWIIRDVDSVFTHTFYNTSFEPIDSPEIYTISLKVKSSKCSDILNTTFTVFPDITADFTLADLDDTLSCNPAIVDFESTLLSINEYFYKWNFGDGSLSAVGDTTHEYINIHPDQDTSYTARLVVRSDWNCRDTAYMDFTIHSYLEGGFTIDKDKGCSPFNVQIENLSSGADSIFLDYGDGNIDTLLSFSIINHFYENNDSVDEVDTNIIVMRVKNDEGCEYIDRDTVLVYPEFTADYIIDGPGNYEGCNSRTVTFTNTTDDGTHLASRYLWEFADGSSMDTTINPIDKLYNNTTSGNKTYDFRLTARSIYGCTDDTTNTISIYRAYANFTVDNNEGCSPLNVNVSNISIGDEINSWDWNFGDIPPGTSTDENPFQYTYNNNGVVNDTNYLVLEVTDSVGGCSTRDTVEIVVYPGIQVSYVENHITVDACDSLVVEFNSTLANPAMPNVTYEWDFGDGGSSSAADTTHVYKNLLLSTSVSRAVNLHVETDMGCFDDASSNIIVNPIVNANIFIDQSAGCSPLTVDVVAQNYPGINSYTWNYGEGGPVVGIDPGGFPYSANTSFSDDVYKLTLDVAGPGGCTDRDSIDVTVYSEVIADFTTPAAPGCNPFTVNFIDGSSVNAVSWQWDFRDGSSSSDPNPTNEFINPDPGSKIFNVKLGVISDRGCEDSIVKPVTVLPYIEADFDINISEGCSPLTVTITNNSLSAGTEWYWYWDKDDIVVNPGVLTAADSTNNFASFTKTFTNNLGSTRVDSLTLIVGNGNDCYEIFKRAITVHTEITAEFNVDPVSQEGCNPLTVDFTNTNILAGGTYTWTFGDGSSSPLPSTPHVFTNTDINDRTFTVRLEAESSDGCSDYMEEDIIVYSKVISSFSIGTGEGCPPFYTSINNTSVGNASDTYQWFIDNAPAVGAPTGTDRSNFNNTYENLVNTTRDYEVKLIATNPHGCFSEHIDIVKVYEYVKADFSMDKDEGCAVPLVVTFTDSSYVPAGTVYSWTYGDGSSSGSTITHTHPFFNASRENDLTRTVKLSVQSPNYCPDDTSLTVEVYHQPLADFFINNTSSCPPLVSTLSSLAEGEDSFEWRFDDGNTNTIDKNLSYTWLYTNPIIQDVQNYTLEFWVGTANNCVDSLSVDLSVFPDVIADFSIDIDADCSPLQSVFTNESSDPATQFFWSFGDGTTTNLENTPHDFVNNGSTDKVYNIFFRATSGYNCWDTITKQVTSYVQPNAEFNVEPQFMIYPQDDINITNLTNIGPFEYDWHFGDLENTTSNEQSPNNFEYEHWGFKIISLDVTSTTGSNCVDSYADTILIMPPLVQAAFTTNLDEACMNDNQEIIFNAYPVNDYGDGYEYFWDFGDDSQATGEEVYHTYEFPGLYYVTLKARSTEIGRENEEDFVYKTIQIYKNPLAEIEIAPKITMLNTDLEARVEFYNLTECNDDGGCAYLWDFGDGTTAISKDVTHNYGEIGLYDISLLVTSEKGCRDSVLIESAVEVIGEGQIKFPNAFVPASQIADNQVFRPVSEGVIEYELLVYNRWGELIFTTKDLDAGWDGKINGAEAKADIYVWKATGKFSNGRSFELAGDITLIR